jgi:hypothetical protein
MMPRESIKKNYYITIKEFHEPKILWTMSSIKLKLKPQLSFLYKIIVHVEITPGTLIDIDGSTRCKYHHNCDIEGLL